MAKDLLSESKLLKQKLVDWRRDFHMHPELGFQETRTSKIVAAELNNLGLDVTEGIAKTGVVGLLNGKKPGKNLVIRVDIDALPIQEENDVSYKSQNKGMMHACGHDGHTAIGLAAATILSQKADEISGTIKFVFQPAEEGQGGAAAMIEEGVLLNPKSDLLLGLHLVNDLPLGTVSVRSGPVGTFHDKLEIRIHGKGGHGAIPQLAKDPVVAAGYMITALQTIVSRNISALDAGVVTIATMQADGASNVIPEEVLLTGTIRAYSEDVRDILHSRIKEIVFGVVNALGCEARVDIKNVNPATVNNPELVPIVYEICKNVVGETNVDTVFRTTGSDDISIFASLIPGCVFYIGSANPQKGLDFPGHHPRFDFDEEALVHGTAILTEAALKLLQN